MSEFGSYFKHSIKALPWIILLPMMTFMLYIFVIDPYYIQYWTIPVKEVNGYTWFEKGSGFILTGMILAVAVNLILLMLIPSAIGGQNPHLKKVEFYVGFCVNLFFTLLLPIIGFSAFGLDGGTFGVLIGLHICAFLIPFVVGARFVAPGYARAFWFIS